MLPKPEQCQICWLGPLWWQRLSKGVVGRKAFCWEPLWRLRSKESSLKPEHPYRDPFLIGVRRMTQDSGTWKTEFWKLLSKTVILFSCQDTKITGYSLASSSSWLRVMIDRILAHDFYSSNYIMLMGKRDFANVIKVTNQLTLKWILSGSDVITWALKAEYFPGCRGHQRREGHMQSRELWGSEEVYEDQRKTAIARNWEVNSIWVSRKHSPVNSLAWASRDCKQRSQVSYTVFRLLIYRNSKMVNMSWSSLHSRWEYVKIIGHDSKDVLSFIWRQWRPPLFWDRVSCNPGWHMTKVEVELLILLPLPPKY